MKNCIDHDCREDKAQAEYTARKETLRRREAVLLCERLLRALENYQLQTAFDMVTEARAKIAMLRQEEL